MKKNLRLLCLGLAAATLTTGFAQENVTEKYLRNANFEAGVAHWDIEADNQIWGVNKSKSAYEGFYGFSGQSLEVWNGSVLKPNSIAQTVALPNGTYVFGAYVGASYNLATPAKPTKAEGVTDEEYKASAEYKEWKAEYDAIRAKFVADSIFGVKMFANLDEVKVATEHPDRGEEKRHTVKYNIATQVTDGKLSVGMVVDSTNVVYVCWDDVQLYDFGNKTPEEALNEMAKIDIQKTLAISDTVVVRYMNNDTLALLNKRIEAAKAIATSAEFAVADEDLRWGIVLGNRSANDYKRLATKISTVKNNMDSMLIKIEGEWLYPWYSAATENVIAQAEAAYAAKAANRAEINELIDSLTLSYAELQFEELDYVLYQLDQFILDNINQFGDGKGQYPTYWKDSLNRLANRGKGVIENFSRETAREDVRLIQDVENSLKACLESVNNGSGAGVFKPVVLTGDPALGESADGAYTYKSEVYNIGARLESVKIAFLDAYCPNGANKGNPPFVAISEFYIYDAAGQAISLSADCFASNASDVDEGKDFGALCDNNHGTFWHSDWHGKVTETHYLEVRVPDGIDLNTFAIGWRTRNANQNIPASVELSITMSGEGYNPLIGQLQSLIKSSNDFLETIAVGKSVGYANVDVAPLVQAVAAAEVLLDAEEIVDDEFLAAIGAIDDARFEIEDAGVVMPVAGKEYRIVSGGPFYKKQGIHKAMTAYSDTVFTNHLWWETAEKNNDEQVFIFEPMENEDGMHYYTVKNKATGLYIGTPLHTEGDKAGEEMNAAALLAAKDTVELVSLGFGQFGLKNSGMLHAGSHNSGVASESAGTYGGVAGVYSSLVKWDGAANDCSAWFICELSEMPLSVLVEGAQFVSETYHFYESVSMFSMAGDKATDFDNLTFYDVTGKLIEDVEIDPAGSACLVTMPEPVIGFSFTFDNVDGVSKVDIVESNLSPLRNAYKEAVDFAPVFSDSIGHYSDATEYEAALAQAEEYFAKGATDEQVVAAVKALEDAVVNLKPNMPAADKTYYLISALSEYEKNYGVPMAMYAKQTKNATTGEYVSGPRWGFMSSKTTRHWRIAEIETAPEDSIAYPVYTIQNVETNEYLTDVKNGADIILTTDAAAAGKFKIVVKNGTSVAIGNAYTTDAYDYLHTNGHGGGAGKGGNIVRWESGAGASQWKIVEVESVLTDIDFTEIEDENDEAVSAKGIYDLYGRRVINPTAPGLYIIDGKKRIIK